MLRNNVIYCNEVWCVDWDWLPSNWCTFGWHKMRYDSVIYKALNLGPLSIYNDWVPVDQKDSTK
jgi:hypothetical protein